MINSGYISRAEDPYVSGQYLEHNPNWHISDSPWKAKQIVSIIHKHSVTPKTICEVGCGAGEILVQLQKELPRNIKFFGYEVSPQAYAMCRQRENDQICFKLENIMDSDVQTFDLLLAIDVFEHVSDYLGFLRGLKSKADKFIFHIPLDISISSVLRPRSFLKVRHDVGHLHYFNRETAIATLIDCGFKPIDWQLTAGALEASSRRGSLNTRLANVPRRIVGSVSASWAARLFGGWSLLVLAE